MSITEILNSILNGMHMYLHMYIYFVTLVIFTLVPDAL